MISLSVLLYITTVWLSAQAIIVSVDRADYKPPQKHLSMYGNGWRPVTNHDEIDFKNSPTNKIQRYSAPLHPVIGKLQEHLGTSDTLKPQNRNRPPDFAPPAILGSFSVFNHAGTKGREDTTLNLKLLPSETRKYSFLLPPHRDPFYSQETKYISNAPKSDPRDPYYSNGPRYSSTSSPLISNRPQQYSYNVQQTLQPPDRPIGSFEYQNSNKQYLIPPSIDYAKEFGKNTTSQQYYNSQNFQPSNLNQNNYYNHQNSYKISYERNPAYLIHESHEIGYVTPSFENEFKPSYKNYIMPPGIYSSTIPPTPINYHQQRPNNINDNQSQINTQQINPTQANNEIYRKIRPEKYNQGVINKTNSYFPQDEEDFVYMPPETQQYFRQTIIPAEQTTEKEYETPESISLKHYNDQLARLAIQKNRERFRDQSINQQEQQFEDYNRQEEEQKLFDKQRLKVDKERTRISENKKEPTRGEYQTKNREQQKVISNNRNPLNQGKIIELYDVTVTEQSPLSRHSTTTQQPIIYYQSTESPQQNYKSPNNYWEHNVQYPQEIFSSTKIPESQRQLDKQSHRGELKIVSLYPDIVNTEIIQNFDTTESMTEIPIFTTISPDRTSTGRISSERISSERTTERILSERTTISPTERKSHRVSGKRRRRPTVATQEQRNTVLKTKEDSERENLNRENRRNQAKKQQLNNEEERKPNNRRRPEVGLKLKNEVEETIKPEKSDKPIEDIVYVTEYPYYQKTSTESTEVITDNLNFEYVTERPTRINNYEYRTETTRPSRINNNDYESTKSSRNNNEYITESTKSRVNNYESITESTKSRVNNYESITESTKPSRVSYYEEIQKTDYIETTTIPTTTPLTTRITQISTTTIPTTKAIHRVRPSRIGNTSRPRFSVKEYKSRLDYKNRISQISTTEANPDNSQIKQKTMVEFKKKQNDSVRDTTRGYKYMSRTYKTTSTTPSTDDQTNTTFTTYTRNKINKFSPKQRPNNGYLYRSRTTSTTSNSIKQDNDNNQPIRSENIYSSSIRQRPSIMRNKLKNIKESDSKDEIEMATEETSFYSHPTIQPESIENQVNEILEVTPSINDDNKNLEEKTVNNSLKIESEFNLNIKSDTINDSTTSINNQTDDELFEKASQSVADLTSSASALYNKPGLFKAVSPSMENRVISTHLKITTGEPTLPIEAFFQNLSDKV